MLIRKFKRMAPENHSFKTSPNIYSMNNKRVYENEKVINNYFLIKVLLKSIFPTYILSVFLFIIVCTFSNYHNLNIK